MCYFCVVTPPNTDRAVKPRLDLVPTIALVISVVALFFSWR